MMTQWQYKVIVDPTESELNELGAIDWELIAVCLNTTHGTEPEEKAYLKRPASAVAYNDAPKESIAGLRLGK